LAPALSIRLPGTTSTAIMAMTASTTRSSISVKPPSTS
jgi:hypothetical protein